MTVSQKIKVVLQLLILYISISTGEEMTTEAQGIENCPDYSLNETCPDYNTTDFNEMCESSSDQEVMIKVLQMCIFTVVLPLGLLGNSLVISTFALYGRLRLRCMTDVFLLHLAICDLLLLLTLPLQAGDTLLGQWNFGTALCKVTRVLHAVNTYSGLLLLACISVDRYVLIVQARMVRRLHRQQLLYGMLVALCIWLVSLILSLPEISFMSVNMRDGTPQCEMNVWVEDSWRVKMATRGTLIAGFCLPFLVMLVCYSLIGCTLLQGRGMRRQRTLRLIVLLVLVFLVFQLPYAVVLSIKVVVLPNTCTQWNTMLLAEYATCSLAYIRCCLNPVLYALVGVRFRNDVLKLFRDTGIFSQSRCSGHMLSHTDSSATISPTSPPATSKSFDPSTPFPNQPPPKPPSHFPLLTSDSPNAGHRCHNLLNHRF